MKRVSPLVALIMNANGLWVGFFAHHTSAQEELSETKISQDFNSMAFLIDNSPIIWWEI